MGNLRQATRQKAKIRLGIAAPSGFGKTYSALLIAYGLCGNWSKVAVIDTEHESADLYSDLGAYNVLPLKPPFTPQKYMDAITECETAGMEVIIIDSCSHVWSGEGGLLEYQNNLGGRYQDWAKTTPLYQKWLNKILQSTSHVIVTVRKKQAYNMIQDGGKTKVEKAGMEDQIRDGFEYELTVALEITNDKHMARASKDRTRLFADKADFVPSIETGKQILAWCESGIEPVKQVMDQNHPQWQNVKDALSANKCDIAYLKKNYELPEEAEKELSKLITIK